MPASGTTTYTLYEGTQPTNYQGTAPFGTITDGNLVVAFGSAPKVGVNANIMFNGQAYNIASAGGTAKPSMAINAAGSFAEVTASQRLSGFLAGPGPSFAGLSYALNPSGVSGVLVFQKGQ